jgi:hypothetical protein
MIDTRACEACGDDVVVCLFPTTCYRLLLEGVVEPSPEDKHTKEFSDAIREH